MRSILEMLGLSASAEETSDGSTDTVRKIVSELEAMESDKARHVAAFAYILGRVAHADLHISAEETRKMEEIVHGLGHLPEDQSVLVVQIAKGQNRLFGGTENYLVTREFAEISTGEQRRDLLDCLFAVSSADGSISGAEESQIRQIASELGFSHRDFVDARSQYNEHREVLKPLLKDKT